MHPLAAERRDAVNPRIVGAAPYADGCSHSIGAFTLHFPAPFCSTRAELAADMARFCVRHNGAKSTLQYTCASLAPQSLFFRKIRPLHACRPRPPVETPGPSLKWPHTRSDHRMPSGAMSRASQAAIAIAYAAPRQAARAYIVPPLRL